MVLGRAHIHTPLGRWWWTVDRYLVAAIAVILMAGMTLVMAASPTIAEKHGMVSHHFVLRQVIFMVMGIAAMVGISMLPLTMVRRFAVLGFLGSVLMLALVPLIGMEVKGATRWIPLFGFSIQPSEFIKPFFSVVTAWFLYRGLSEEGFPGYMLVTVLYGIVALLLITQPDFGMTIAVSVVWGAQLFLAGLPMAFVVGILIFGLLGATTAYLTLPHVAQRLNTFFDPSSGDTYQSDRALEAIINGGLLGQGPGEGVIKEIIPDAHTDFIFAVAGEEFGLFPSMLIVALFAFIIIRGFMLLMREKNLFIVLAGGGLLIQFGLQAIVNMGVALSLLPNTGMTLPFISYGGSSTLAISCAMGMILAFTRKRYNQTEKRL